MEIQELRELLNKEKNNNLSEPERQRLEDWYKSLNVGTTAFKEDDPNNLELSEQMLLEFRQKWLKPTASLHKITFMHKLMRAAAIIISISLIGAAYLLFFNKPKQEIATIQYQKFESDITPPANAKAVLTLADGSKINLDSMSNGTLAVQGKTNVVKQADGLIAYEGAATKTIGYNTLTVPKGSKPMKLLLVDGSRVWLNVASSITYPTAFTGKERRVSVSGEAYFEIAHDASKPFVVRNGSMDVQVLGTHFNVNTFEDDDNNIKVTLLEGAVKINNGDSKAFLKPGQQALVSNKVKVVDDVDLDKVMAWKNGYFQFDKASLQSVLKQVSRWYDVEVIYQGKNRPREFIGEIERDLSLSEVLKILKINNVNFTIEEKKLIIKPDL
jgi:ferric-dicitrate binding protein FerR (iron transport regulator)